MISSGLQQYIQTRKSGNMKENREMYNLCSEHEYFTEEIY